MRKFLILWWALVPLALNAQGYAVSVERNIIYGVSPDFAGRMDTLRLDIFKPVGDGRVDRPLFVYTHGGAWLEVSNKNGAEDVGICMEMARRGFVVANVEYRRGYHRLHTYTPYAFCAAVIQDARCTFAYDSSEFIRATYRGMQDVRGAIRFMKARHLQDSTDIKKVIAGGASAGGFIALYATYLDCPGEKPISCGALPPVMPAHPEFSFCYPPGVMSVQRPDLGDIEGSLHRQNGYDATVVGVVNFFGGVFHNLLPGPPGQPVPALYAFHQTNDVIVDCGVKPPLRSYYDLVVAPLNLCQPVIFPPPAAGSCAIFDVLQKSGLPADLYEVHIVQNGPPNAIADPPGHSVDNRSLRVDELTHFFEPYLNGSKKLPLNPVSCTTGSTLTQTPHFSLLCRPGIFGSEGFTLALSTPGPVQAEYFVLNTLGQVVETGRLSGGEGSFSQTIGRVNNWSPGVYYVITRAGTQVASARVMRH